MSVVVHFDRKRTFDAMAKALYATKNEILEDCRFYAREDTGALIRSGHAEEVGGANPEVVISFSTPYAERVYFEGKPSTDKNAHASLKWCHVAAENNLEKWTKNWAARVMKMLGD